MHSAKNIAESLKEGKKILLMFGTDCILVTD